MLPKCVLSSPFQSPTRGIGCATLAGLTSVCTYGDKGCDCATENAPVEQILPGWQQLHAVNKCSQDCCGDEGILLKKYERTLSVAFDANAEHSQRLDVSDR